MTMICPICGQDTQHDADASVVKCRQCLRSFQLESMNTESQLARKAALECIGKTGSEKEAIILSAIERATELTAVERAENKRNKAVVEAIAAAQPQRREQDWTSESIISILDKYNWRNLPVEALADLLVVQHEARSKAAQPQRSEQLKECSAVSTKPVKTERQPIIRSIEDSLISTPQRSELTDEQIRACICTIGDKINPKCPTHTVSEQQEWKVLMRQAKAYAQCNCPDAPRYHSNCQRKLLPILEQIDAAFTAERQQERKSNAPRSLEANCGQLP